MFRQIVTGCVLALVAPALTFGADALGKTTKGKPEIKSIEAVSFGPGVLLIGDGRGSQVVAVKVPQMAKQSWGSTDIANIKDKLADKLGTNGKAIEILKLAVEPQSQTPFLLVRKNATKEDVLVTLESGGNVGLFNLDNVEYAAVSLAGEKGAVSKITDIAWSPKGILVSAQASDTFPVKIIVVPAPVNHGAKESIVGTETFHVAHSRWETAAPIRSVLSYEEGGKNYILGAFTCTPIVKYPLDKLDPKVAIKGESMIEIGSGNQPLDMFRYEKDGKSYILMSMFRFHHAKAPVGPLPNWTVKVDQAVLSDASKVNENAVRRVGGKNATDLATVAEAYHGTLHMDRLDNARAMVVKTDGKDGVNLTILNLP